MPGKDLKAASPAAIDSSSSTSSPHPHWFYSSEKDTWVTFPPKDNEALEAKWNELGGKEWWLKQRDDRRKEEEAKEREKVDRRTKDQRQEESKSKGNEAQDGDEEAPSSGSYWTGILRTWFNVGSLDDLSTSSSPSDPPPSDEKKSNIKQEEQEATMIEEIVDPSEPESARRLKVAVLEDRLFDVDVAKMTLYPVFFKGVLLSVIRSEWFYWSEMKGQYSPIRWESDLSRDLERAWQEGRAWELSTTSSDGDDAEKDSKDSSIRQETDLMDIRSEETEGKGKVKFTSPVEGKVFTEDIRGRFVSLIGGSTVIRGFDEVERRTGVDKDKKKRRGLFGGMPDLPTMSKPWASKEETLNEAASSSGKAGAAQPDNEPPQSSGDSKGKQGDAGGFTGKLVPSTDRWWARPTMTFLNAFGLAGGEEEAQRSQQQTNTEKAVDVDGTKNDEAKQEDKETASDAEVQDNDVEGAVNDESKSADQLDPCDDDEVDDEGVEDQVHLVLCVHGIGQGLRDDFESLDFTYDVQKLRKLSQQRVQEEGIHSLVHSTRVDADGKTIKIRRRVQYIPICWRRSLDLAYHPEENDNHFDLVDVTNTSIDFIRNVVSKVVLDVPFYLSPVYKPMMVKAVTEELNRIYRLWIRRNPGWLERGGKASLISHSLGSCLSADVLARQPTFVSPISDLSNKEIRETSGSRLHFNVQDLYLVGSPLGLFLLLSGSQLIARSVPRNESYESRSGKPSSLGEEGKEGCMAIHGSLYNVYNDSDPVAYRCNAAVDSRYAKLLRPVPLPGAVNAIVDSLKAPRLELLGFFDSKEPFKSLKEKWDSSQEERKRATKGMDKEKVKEATASLRRYAKTDDRATTDGGKDKDTASGHSDDDDDEDRKRRTTPQHSGFSSPVRLEKGSKVKETLLPELALKKEQELREAQSSSRDEDKKQKKSSEPKKTSLSHLESASSRFLSLNRHGAVDFFYTTNPTNNSFLTGSGLASSWGEYVSMLSAHNGYWTSPSVVGLVLTQILGGEQEGEEERKQRGKEDSVTLVPSVGTTS